MKTTLNLTIGDENWINCLPDGQELSENVFQDIMTELNPEFLQDKETISLNLELGNDEEIRQLNREFRNLDKPTNILSFANLDDDDFFDELPATKDVELGDIIIALETMKLQSTEQEISFKDHYIHILTHGILHLLGYDHIEEEDRIEMETMEIRLLERFGVADPYEEKA